MVTVIVTAHIYQWASGTDAFRDIIGTNEEGQSMFNQFNGALTFLSKRDVLSGTNDIAFADNKSQCARGVAFYLLQRFFTWSVPVLLYYSPQTNFDRI